jgi:hypothetical protein
LLRAQKEPMLEAKVSLEMTFEFVKINSRENKKKMIFVFGKNIIVLF